MLCVYITNRKFGGSKKIDLLLGKEALKLMKINSLPSLHCITLQHIGVFFYIQTEIIFHIVPFYLYL